MYSNYIDYDIIYQVKTSGNNDELCRVRDYALDTYRNFLDSINVSDIADKFLKIAWAIKENSTTDVDGIHTIMRYSDFNDKVKETHNHTFRLIHDVDIEYMYKLPPSGFIYTEEIAKLYSGIFVDINDIAKYSDFIRNIHANRDIIMSNDPFVCVLKVIFYKTLITDIVQMVETYKQRILPEENSDMTMDASLENFDAHSSFMYDNFYSSEGKILDKVRNALVTIPGKMNTMVNRVKFFHSDRKNILFYKKHLGKINGMFKRYGDDAYVVENDIRGDPVVLLRNSASKYIVTIGEKLAALNETFMSMSKALAKCESYDKAEKIILEFGNSAKLRNISGREVGKKNDLAVVMYFSLREKIVDILLENNEEIYGFNKESMIAKKLPPPNHTIVSLFVANPQEKPTERSVASLFDGPESFTIMAASEKTKIFDIRALSDAIMRDNLTSDNFKQIKKNTLTNMNKMSDHARDSDKAKEELKKLQKLKKGMKKCIDLMGKMKIYTIDCINIYFSMVLRIDDLCRRSMEALLAIEASKTDKDYKSSGAGKANQKYNPDKKKDEEND